MDHPKGVPKREIPDEAL